VVEGDGFRSVVKERAREWASKGGGRGMSTGKTAIYYITHCNTLQHTFNTLKLRIWAQRTG